MGRMTNQRRFGGSKDFTLVRFHEGLVLSQPEIPQQRATGPAWQGSCFVVHDMGRLLSFPFIRWSFTFFRSPECSVDKSAFVSFNHQRPVCLENLPIGLENVN